MSSLWTMSPVRGGLVVLAYAGWFLGIIGFFIARSARSKAQEAMRQVLALRGLVERPASAQGAAGVVVADGTVRVTAEPAATSHEPVAASAPAAQESTPRVTAPPVAAPPRDLEAVFTTRWTVWLGSVALLFAGVFLIRYAAEQGLLGPGARCVLAVALGACLLAAAEWLQRGDTLALPAAFGRDQAPAALAAGGTAILFGAAYGGGPFYHLLPEPIGFAAMAAASLIGLAAALRFGPLTAAVGIVGAFVTPALVATETPSMPGLFAYLLLVSAAALLVVRRTAWVWLGWATTIAGAVWVCIAGLPPAPDPWAAAAFVPLAAALNLELLPPDALAHKVGRYLAWVPFAALGAAGLVLEAAVPGAAPRAALFLLSPVAVWRGWTELRLDRLPWVAAVFGLLTLLAWVLPDWHSASETIGQGLLFGGWAPQAIRPLLIAATGFAGFHAACGLVRERSAANPLPWAALVAAVPVLTLAVTYAQVARFQTDFAWAGAALILAGGLTVTSAASAANRRRAGVHAAGAVAALALGCAMLLHQYWLTLAIALFLPPLAWIEAQADLPPLRPVALAVAALVLTRLMLNVYVVDYAFGTEHVLNGLIPAYAVPAGAFACAAVLFRRRRDDLLVATLEGGAIALAAVFIAAEIRHWYVGVALPGGTLGTGLVGFEEAALHTTTLALQATAYLRAASRLGRPILRWAWHMLGSIALLAGVALLLVNPMVSGMPASPASLLMAYAIPSVLAALAVRPIGERGLRHEIGAYAVLAGFAWITLQIRQYFHPDQMLLTDAPVVDAELWGWSGAWLVYAIFLMVLGIRTRQQLIRLAALCVSGLVCAKVFLIDMSGLSGLWRVLSFLGLGLALIGLGVIYRRFVLIPQPDPPAAG